MRRRDFMGAVGLSASAAIAGCLSSGDDSAPTALPSASVATVHMTPTCACCEAYAEYLSEKTDIQVNESLHGDLTEIKQRFGIPDELTSCHTVELETEDGTRVVEGHVPVEAVETMLEGERSKIALPEMPSGSPGMGGVKTGPFTVYAVDDDGGYEVFGEF